MSKERNQFQSAYELLVSDNLKDLTSLQGNVWTTGKITSSQQLHIDYGGATLRPFTRYYWRVKVYNQSNLASAWSSPTWFETAMLAATDWQAGWIGDGSHQYSKEENFYRDDCMPLFRKVFAASRKIASVRLYISGLGYYEAYVNGRKISDHVLDPGWTISEAGTVRGAQHGALLNNGTNVAGVMLGNDWYNPLPLTLFGKFNLRNVQQTGRPCVKAEIRIRYEDGSTETISF